MTTGYLGTSKAMLVLNKKMHDSCIYKYVISKASEQFTISTPFNDPFSPAQIDPSGEFKRIQTNIPAYMEKLKNAELFDTAENLTVRLKSSNGILGFIIIYNNPDQNRFFSSKESDFIKVLADTAANILQKKNLEETQKKGEKLSIIGRMVASIVHDIRNPLSGISGFARIIQSRTRDSKIKSLAGIMVNELTKLEEMNNEILSYVRGEELLLDLDTYFSREIIEELVTTIEPEFQKLNINIEIIDDYNGPIYMDRNKMFRVFMNIAQNARDAIRVDGKFKIFCKNDEKNIIFEFEDNGIGMPAYVCETIFEPFVTYGKSHGTGLGMAIAKNIVTAHKGDIAIESTVDLGSIIIIKLPFRT
ncbi:MAG: HAMP domain-containing sensor histidine kinase [bacterium]